MGLSRKEAWEVLELEEGASEAEIKTQWKRLALANHPDKNGAHNRRCSEGGWGGEAAGGAVGWDPQPLGGRSCHAA